MEFYLKKDPEYCPIAFKNPEFSEKNLIRMDTNGQSYKKSADNIIDINHCMNHDKPLQGNYFYSRGVYLYYNRGIIHGSNGKIYLLMTEKNREPFVFIENRESWRNDAMLKRIYKQLKTIGIKPEQCKFEDNAILISRFCDPLAPTMDDYLEEVQDSVFSGFKEYINNLGE